MIFHIRIIIMQLVFSPALWVRSVCFLQDDDDHVNIHFFSASAIGQSREWTSWWSKIRMCGWMIKFRSCICIGVNSSSRGSVDIGSVDLFQVHYRTVSFSPAPGSEECLLFFMTMTIAWHTMPLLLTRLCGTRWLHIRYLLEAKRLSLSGIPLLNLDPIIIY